LPLFLQTRVFRYAGGHIVALLSMLRSEGSAPNLEIMIDNPGRGI
jgi:hypothetical protein